MSFSSLFITVFVCLSLLTAQTSFNCSKLVYEDDCEKIGYCTWNSTCINDTNISGGGCRGMCVEDPCFRILLEGSTESCSYLSLGKPYTCEQKAAVGDVREHHCSTSSVNSTILNIFCQIQGSHNLSACFLNYYKTANCTKFVNGQYCKLYSTPGGRVCDKVDSAENENILDKSCERLSVENCKYNPTCYISDSSCVTDPCTFNSEYDYLTQKCEEKNSCGNPQYECVAKTVPKVLVKFDYVNKTASPAINDYNAWTYKAKRNWHYNSNICIDEKRHTTPPNTCYYLSTYIYKNPTYNQQNNPIQPESWWNYCETNGSRDSCLWWTGNTVDATACTGSRGCSVVDVGTEKICTSDVSAGSSFVRSPSFVFVLIFVGVLSFLFN